jgi:RNase P subunit RPR2
MSKKVTIEVELGAYQFQCDKCKTIHDKSAYAIAQQAMGVALIFTCECGHKTHL